MIQHNCLDNDIFRSSLNLIVLQYASRNIYPKYRNIFSVGVKQFISKSNGEANVKITPAAKKRAGSHAEMK